ncbi:MAG: RNA polymerase sigma factor [Porphyromonas sp.]|nr:RNA polymerase sigma factor [Porphyromonas sp.]
MQKQEFIDTFVCLSNKLERVACSVVHDEQEAKDLVQEVLLRLWLSRDKLEQYVRPEALAIKMIKNRAIDKLRKEERLSRNEDLSGIVSPMDTDTTIEQMELGKHLRAAILQLPRLQRMVFFLKEVQGYEAEEIAQIVGAGVEAVYNNLSRARRRLRETLLLNGIGV